MKLNYDLIRELLEKIESECNGKYLKDITPLDNFTEDEINYHLLVLKDGNFIKAEVKAFSSTVRVYQLTYKGHEYLESIRNKYIWEQVKKDVELKGLRNVSIDLLKELANKKIKEILNI